MKQKALWKTSQDIKRQYASASFLSDNRVVFNIKANQYGLVVAVAYGVGAVYDIFVDMRRICTDVITIDYPAKAS